MRLFPINFSVHNNTNGTKKIGDVISITLGCIFYGSLLTKKWK